MSVCQNKHVFHVLHNINVYTLRVSRYIPLFYAAYVNVKTYLSGLLTFLGQIVLLYNSHLDLCAMYSNLTPTVYDVISSTHT